MFVGYEENEWSDNEYDYDDYIEYPDWFIKEELYFSKLYSINAFKKFMESEIYGISRISDADLLDIVESTDNLIKLKYDYVGDNKDIFDDLWLTLFNRKESHEIYNNLIYKIHKKCYIC